MIVKSNIKIYSERQLQTECDNYLELLFPNFTNVNPYYFYGLKPDGHFIHEEYEVQVIFEYKMKNDKHGLNQLLRYCILADHLKPITYGIICYPRKDGKYFYIDIYKYENKRLIEKEIELEEILDVKYEPVNLVKDKNELHVNQNYKQEYLITAKLKIKQLKLSKKIFNEMNEIINRMQAEIRKDMIVDYKIDLRQLKFDIAQEYAIPELEIMNDRLYVYNNEESESNTIAYSTKSYTLYYMKYTNIHKNQLLKQFPKLKSERVDLGKNGRHTVYSVQST